MFSEEWTITLEFVKLWAYPMNNKVSESPGNSCNLEYPKNDTFELYTKKLISLSQMINQTISTHRMTYDKQRLAYTVSIE